LKVKKIRKGHRLAPEVGTSFDFSMPNYA